MMGHVEESVKVQQWKCSKCDQPIVDENEYIDNDGVCDTCYSLLIKRRIGLVKK
jgi:hypothetical protein